MTVIHKAMILSVVAAAAIGCSPRLYPARDVRQERTVTTEVRDRDTLIAIRPDSSLICARVVLDSAGRFSLREYSQKRTSNLMTVKLDIDDGGLLTVKAVTGMQPVPVKLTDRRTVESVSLAETVTETVEVNVLRWWQKALMWLGVAMLAVIAAWAVRLVIKLKTNGVQTLIKQLSNIS